MKWKFRIALAIIVVGCVITFNWSYGFSNSEPTVSESQFAAEISTGQIYFSYSTALMNPLNVRELYLQPSDVAGAEIAGFKNLEIINLTCKQLNSMPDEFFNITGVRAINVSGIDTATLTAKIVAFKELESLSCTGRLPREVGQITTLKTLSTFRFQQGTDLSKLKLLHSLSLSESDSTLLSTCPQIETLTLSSIYKRANRSSAESVPSCIANMIHLKTLNLSNFLLNAASLKSSIATISKLKELKVLSYLYNVTDSSVVRNFSSDSTRFAQLEKLTVCPTETNRVIFSTCKGLDSLHVLYNEYAWGVDYSAPNTPILFKAQELTRNPAMDFVGPKRIEISYLGHQDSQHLINLSSLSTQVHLISLEIDGLNYSSRHGTFGWISSLSKLDDVVFRSCSNLPLDTIFNHFAGLKLNQLTITNCHWLKSDTTVLKPLLVSKMLYVNNENAPRFNWGCFLNLQKITTDINHELLNGLSKKVGMVELWINHQDFTIDNRLEIATQLAPVPVTIRDKSGISRIIENHLDERAIPKWKPNATSYADEYFNPIYAPVTGEDYYMITWYASGELEGIKMYSASRNRIVMELAYHQSGLEKSYKLEFLDRSEIPHVRITSFDASGTIVQSERYLYDQLDGRQYYFYPNQKLKAVRQYSGGKKTGTWLSWTSNGKMNTKNYE